MTQFETILLIVTTGTLFLSMYVLYNLHLLFSQGVVDQFLNSVTSGPGSRVISIVDQGQILSIVGMFGLRAIAFTIASLAAFIINTIAIGSVPEMSSGLQIAVALTNAWIIAECRIANKLSGYIRYCENRIVSEIMIRRAIDEAKEQNPDQPIDDGIGPVLLYLDREQGKLEQEMKDNGEWPPTDEDWLPEDDDDESDDDR